MGWFVGPLAVVVMTGLFATPAVLPAMAGAVPTNINTSAAHGNEAEDAIAVNPTNPKNIVTMATLPFPVVAGLFEGISFDGGKTWTRQVIGSSTADPLGDICCDEQLAWDGFGNLWMTYLLNSNGDVLVALSTDGGRTFHKTADVIVTGVGTGPGGSKNLRTNNPNIFGDQPSISAGLNSVWISFTNVPSEVIQAFGFPVTGLGQYGPLTPTQAVPTSAGRGDYGDTAVGPNGQVLVTYQDATNGQGGSHIYTALDPDGLGPAGFNDPLELARSRVGGFDYIPAQSHRSVDAEASLAWDRSGGPHTGRVYAVWTQENGNESDDMDIMFQYSDDNGTTWSPAVRLNDDHTTNSQFMPAIALDQSTGNVAVSWYDARGDLGAGSPTDTDGVPNDDVQIWATYSIDGGVTFIPNFQVSQGASNSNDAASGFDYGDYTHAAFQSKAFYPAWSDNSNSTGDNPDGTLHQLDLYTAKVTVP